MLSLRTFTYADFDALFLAAPLLALMLALRRRLLRPLFLALAGGLALVALVYMVPWDHVAAVWGLWSWSHSQTWGVRWWNVPPEEYLFCVLEALLATTLIYAALLWSGRIADAPARLPSPRAMGAVPQPSGAPTVAYTTNGAQRPSRDHAGDRATDDSQQAQASKGNATLPQLVALPIALVGAITATSAHIARFTTHAPLTHWPYLPFLLVWALPVIAVQWALGGRYLWRERRVWPWVALALCAYFTLADAVAIDAHIWSFDRAALLGVSLGPVPIEETLFYLLTALMVTQGFVTLWYGHLDREAIIARARGRLDKLRIWRAV